MLGIISGLKRSTEGGIGKIYLGLLGSNLYSTPFTSCTIVFANSGSRFKRFKSIKRYCRKWISLLHAGKVIRSWRKG